MSAIVGHLAKTKETGKEDLTLQFLYNFTLTRDGQSHVMKIPGMIINALSLLTSSPGPYFNWNGITDFRLSLSTGGHAEC